MSAAEIRNFSTLSNTRLHIHAIRNSHWGATSVNCGLRVLLKGTSLDLLSGRKRHYSTPGSFGDSNWHPRSHKPSSITFMPPAHAYAFAQSGGPLSASEAVCLCLSRLNQACLCLIGRILWEQEMGILVWLYVWVFLCVAIWSMKTDGWVIHFKLLTFAAANTVSSVVYFYPYLCPLLFCETTF